MKILVTGGAGYIGTHTVVALIESGHDVIVVDNLSNSKEAALERVREITGKPIEFHRTNLLDGKALAAVFASAPIDAVIHLAGFKSVSESVEMPLRYYHNNLTAALVLCEVMAEARCRNLVFSSSATVYGDPATVPILESFPLSATNPYGHSKLMIEQILSDLHLADPKWNIALLRYFNPVGAHPSGRIGEDARGIPNNLMPYLAQVALGKLPELTIFGNNYPTPDGTGVRDYIHVTDLAAGHVEVLGKLRSNPGLLVYNLGTGRGWSVLEMIAAFERASGRKISFRIAPRRAGDVAVCYADASKAKAELGWEARRGVDEMCADTWRWQSANPSGYE
jgi:UDP-glucose 4-epimerase